MKYKESFEGEKTDFAAFIKKAVPDLFAGRLSVEGQNVSVPADSPLSYDVKFNEDEDGGSVTIKVAWSKDVDEDEDEDEEEVEL